MDIVSYIKNTSKQLCVIVLFFWSRWELIAWSLQISNLLFCSCLYDGSVAFENFNGSFFSTLFLPRFLGHGTVSLFPLCPLSLPPLQLSISLEHLLNGELSRIQPLQMRSLRMTPKAIFPSLISLLRFRPIFPNGCGHHTPGPHVLHSALQQVLQIPQTGRMIFPPALLPILCLSSQLMVLPSVQSPRQKFLILFNNFFFSPVISSHPEILSTPPV